MGALEFQVEPDALCIDERSASSGRYPRASRRAAPDAAIEDENGFRLKRLTRTSHASGFDSRLRRVSQNGARAG